MTTSGAVPEAGASPTLRRVLAGELCSGCGLCASVAAGAVVLETQAPGYTRPRQVRALTAAQERTIATACPGAAVAPWPAAGEVHPYWGPFRSIRTGFALDEATRFQGSSGGAVTALAAHALRAGLAERVVHVTADPQDPAGNMVAVSATPEAVIAGAGSRYVSSSPLSIVEDLLAEGRSFVFVGKPCDVSALRQLARVDARVDALAKLTLAFFCAGVPSRGAVARVLGALKVDPSELASFRYRGNGWPGRATAVTRDGRVADMSYEDSWGGFLSHEVQFRCKICPDAVGGVADIACADAWYGGESGYPSFEELDGRSLVIGRTERGEAFLAAAATAGALATEPLEIGEIELMQPSQARRKRLIRARTAALRALLRPVPVMRELRVGEAARRAPAPEQLRNFLGTVRRALNGRLSRR